MAESRFRCGDVLYGRHTYGGANPDGGRSYFRDWREWPAFRSAMYVDTVKLPGTMRRTIIPIRIISPGFPARQNDLVCLPMIWIHLRRPDLRFSSDRDRATNDAVGICFFHTVEDIIFKHVKLIYKGLPATPATAVIDSF